MFFLLFMNLPVLILQRLSYYFDLFFQDPNVPHFLRVAKFGHKMQMRIDNMPAAYLSIGKTYSSNCISEVPLK